MDLVGGWQVSRLTSSAPDPASETTWFDAAVPGHWQRVTALRDWQGPVVYRRTLDGAPLTAGRRRFLHLDGVFQLADVWLDDSYLGATEGYFVPYSFEVTDHLAGDGAHQLRVEVAAPPQPHDRGRRQLTGTWQPRPGTPPEHNPGGIWRPVRLVETGAVHIRHFRAVCSSADARRARITLRAVLDAAAAGTVDLLTSVAGVEHVLSQPVAAGENRVNWFVDVTDPTLWWPAALGERTLHELRVAVRTEPAGEGAGDRGPGDGISDERRMRIGLRSVRFDGAVLRVNGEPLFCKAVVLDPPREYPADGDAAVVAGDADAIADVGADLVRLRAHVARPELYDRADERGLLIWQDLPLLHGAARSVRRPAMRQARELVDLLGHHPSVALWCGHAEPLGPRPSGLRARLARGVRQQLPTWSRSVLDRSVKLAFERADRARPVIAHTAMAAHFPRLRGTDLQRSFGAPGEDPRDLARLAARLPAAVRMIGGIGPARGPLGAEAVRLQVETARRIKYHPTGIVLVTASPGEVGWSVLSDAFAPVVVTADPLPAQIVPGQALALDVHVVSDLRRPLDEAIVDATISWPGGRHRWAWRGDVSTDSCTRVATIAWVAPDPTPGGPVVLELTLRVPGDVVHNRYESVLSPGFG